MNRRNGEHIGMGCGIRSTNASSFQRPIMSCLNEAKDQHHQPQHQQSHSQNQPHQVNALFNLSTNDLIFKQQLHLIYWINTSRHFITFQYFSFVSVEMLSQQNSRKIEMTKQYFVFFKIRIWFHFATKT